MNEISIESATALLNAFDQDYPIYTFIPVNEPLLQLSRQLLDKHGQSGLRSLDTIQLASAIIVQQEVQLFKTADTLLNTLFAAEALPVSIV